ncbi:hypothetical protein F5B22DRAFT_638336 [Xylaria bambusicola]|uniref:uncharacterized protein n=1 Tax=Xylaria bambusicola TaxID=326684 RepID=UPI00200889FB|nr:uncharacterized protein F5B22DRAFT_638336 [Xylaria bambusicola]KAI0508947.1 hypothetical protein F5B22DRAFT_638336 [Xylaria bambusicola]
MRSAAARTVRTLQLAFLRKTCGVSAAYLSYKREGLTLLQHINAIYESRDPAKVKELNTARRTAGEKVISRLLANINCDALRWRAKALRDGINCTVNLPPPDQAYFNTDVLGGYNCHGSLLFRLPNHNEPPLQERNFDRRSEFATSHFLAESAVPVPEVYDCADDNDPMNPVSAGYILLKKLASKLLASGQLASISINLEKHPLNAFGRLQLSSMGLPEVSPAFFDYDSNENLIPFGPFSQPNDYYRALVQRKIQLIGTVETANSAPLDQYLVYKSLLDTLPPNESGPFPIRHVDSRNANFLVDGDYNITGIIDWELTVCPSKGSAFQSPLLMYNLGGLYNEGLIDQVIETDPWDREMFESVFSGWWKATPGADRFD